MKYEQVFQHGHGWVDVKVCEQCDRAQHVDLIGYRGQGPLFGYWFDCLACLHDAQRGVIPKVSKRNQLQVPLKEVPVTAAEVYEAIPAGVRWADICAE